MNILTRGYGRLHLLLQCIFEVIYPTCTWTNPYGNILWGWDEYEGIESWEDMVTSSLCAGPKIIRSKETTQVESPIHTWALFRKTPNSCKFSDANQKLDLRLYITTVSYSVWWPISNWDEEYNENESIANYIWDN